MVRWVDDVLLNRLEVGYPPDCSFTLHHRQEGLDPLLVIRSPVARLGRLASLRWCRRHPDVDRVSLGSRPKRKVVRKSSSVCSSTLKRIRASYRLRRPDRNARLSGVRGGGVLTSQLGDQIVQVYLLLGDLLK